MLIELQGCSKCWKRWLHWYLLMPQPYVLYQKLDSSALWLFFLGTTWLFQTIYYTCQKLMNYRRPRHHRLQPLQGLQLVKERLNISNGNSKNSKRTKTYQSSRSEDHIKGSMKMRLIRQSLKRQGFKRKTQKKIISWLTLKWTTLNPWKPLVKMKYCSL